MNATLTARMPNPASAVPGSMDALLGLAAVVKGAGLPPVTQALVHMRASQINGCGMCVGLGLHDLRKLEVSDERLVSIAAWRDTPYFTDAERAALALTEAVTRLADHPDAVPDEVWNEAARHYDQGQLGALVLYIATTNLWNRLNVATRQIAGTYRA